MIGVVVVPIRAPVMSPAVGGLAVGSSSMTCTETVMVSLRPWLVPRTPI